MKKIVLVIALILVMIVPASGCGYMSEYEALSLLEAWLENYEDNEEESEDEEDGETGPMQLQLTYPAGRSPNVFTTGWVFGASCTLDGKDYSDQVKWSGSGSFSPDTGTRSRPSFNSEGANTITLSVKINNKDYKRTFTVNAISPAMYAHVGMLAFCEADSHGCPADPLSVIGPITTGSANVLVNGKPAARVGDVGVHAACAGANTFTIIDGDDRVLIDGRRAAWSFSTTRHCGGVGKILIGSK